MGKKLYPTNTLEQAQSILAAWDAIDPAQAFGPLTVEDLSSDVASIQVMQEKILQLKIELVSLRNERDAACIGLWDKVKRSRAAFKGFYGDDSSEYEMAGGTRLSERKPIRRRGSSKSE